MAPWVHAHMSSLGDFTPCCEIQEPLGESTGATIESVWNSDAMASLRLAMLSEAPQKACRICYEKEKLGATSRRQNFNASYGDQAHRLDATMHDGTVPASVRPIDLDLRFSNLCNFRCRSCWHGASSRWFSDSLALGWTAGKSAIITAGADRAKTLDDAMQRLPELRIIYFAGGEALLMEEHYLILEELLRLGRNDVCLIYNTNLSELSFGGRSAIDLWRQFRDVWVGASADGMGAVGELVRKGMSWRQFEENLQAVRAACPHVHLSLAATISVLNIFHLTDFYRHAVGSIGFAHSEISLNPLQNPPHYNIQILPPDLKHAAATALNALVSSLEKDARGKADAGQIETTKANMQHLVNFLWASDERRHIAAFLRITDRLDALRSENTFATIPELAVLRELSG
jgi:hypothetical protein